MRRLVRIGLPLLLAAAPLGCGRGYSVAPVAGKVALDGKPLADAEVRFYPAGKGQPYSVGETDAQGHYTLRLGDGSDAEGAVVGEHRVTISKDERNLEKPIGPKGPRELVPARYNRDSTLSFTVPPGGTQDANFDLKSR